MSDFIPPQLPDAEDDIQRDTDDVCEFFEELLDQGFSNSEAFTAIAGTIELPEDQIKQILADSGYQIDDSIITEPEEPSIEEAEFPFTPENLEEKQLAIMGALIRCLEAGFALKPKSGVVHKKGGEVDTGHKFANAEHSILWRLSQEPILQHEGDLELQKAVAMELFDNVTDVERRDSEQLKKIKYNILQQKNSKSLVIYIWNALLKYEGNGVLQ